jgi:hypothetical protein
VKKPAIPSPQTVGDQKIREILMALRERIEIITGMRGKLGEMEPLVSGWNDTFCPIVAGMALGANQPTWAAFRSGIYAYSFGAAGLNEVWVVIPIPHDYVPVGKVYPNIHWSTGGVPPGVCRWGIEYSYARAYGADAFPASTTIYIEQAASGTAYTHMLAEVTDANAVSFANPEADGLFIARVFRDGAHANDTLTDAAFAFMVSLHYQSDNTLTKQRNRGYTKAIGLSDVLTKLNSVIDRLEN